MAESILINFTWDGLRLDCKEYVFNCEQCQLSGATVGCAAENCFRNYHFSCAEDSGWRFDRDGKHFFCDLHRNDRLREGFCDRISLQHFRSKHPGKPTTCSLCLSDDDAISSEILAFQSGPNRICAHVNCLRYTTIVDTTPDSMSRFEDAFRNVFAAVDRAGICAGCGSEGATIGCSHPKCRKFYHLPCAKNEPGWKPLRGQFVCRLHAPKESLQPQL